MELQRIKKIQQMVINFKRQQFNTVGYNSRLKREIKQLEVAVKNIVYTLTLAENRELKNLLGEGLELIERLEHE